MLRTGAMALAAAGASTAAHAATVQITFNNSFISSMSGIHLVTDFGGDGTADIQGYSSSGWGVDVRPFGGGGAVVLAVGAPTSLGNGGLAVVRGYAAVTGGAIAQAMQVTAFTLVDTKVRGGAATSGWLDVSVTGWPSGQQETGRVDVLRFIFDDASGVAPTGVSHSSGAFPAYVAAVPEPSGLGLLALGAGGLLARRRRAMAA